MADGQENIDLSTLLRFYKQQQKKTHEESIQESQQVSDTVYEDETDFNQEEFDLRENSYILESQRYVAALQQESRDIEKKWSVEIFINDMRSYACLWDTSTRSYHDQNMRKTSWEELSSKFGKPGISSRFL